MTRNIGEGTKSNDFRRDSGFYSRYMSGSGADIGFKGQWDDSVPVLASAVGVELGYRGYDGNTLPWDDSSLDYIYSSHLLEHIAEPLRVITDWHRTIKVGGHIITIVPHQYLYEKKASFGCSRWNADHKRFYTPGSLIKEFEAALKPNTYRVRECYDNDVGYDYSIPPSLHANGAYEIVLVVQKIAEPSWELDR